MTPGLDAVAAANRLSASWASRHEQHTTAFSGVGVWVLLAMLEAGAAGRALEELEGAVGLPLADAATGVRRLQELAAASTAMQAALAVWAHQRIPIEEPWLASLPLGMLGLLSGDADADQAAMDRWVEEQTGGELRHLPVTVDGETLMVLASALAVRTRWARPFTPVPRTLAGGAWAGTEAVELYRSTSRLDDVRVVDGGAGPITVLRVEGADDVDVFVVLGEPEAHPGAVLAEGLLAAVDGRGLDGASLPEGTPGPGVSVAIIESAQPDAQLSVRTVAFDVAASHDLLERAADFGLETATTKVPGHFPGVSSEPLAVGQARQDVMARFTHEGFIAAAVTAMSMVAGSAPPTATFRIRRVTVTFDRPFGFVAVHRTSRLVLVAGWVDEPAAP